MGGQTVGKKVRADKYIYHNCNECPESAKFRRKMRLAPLITRAWASLPY
jgi:hypothetical protein